VRFRCAERHTLAECNRGIRPKDLQALRAVSQLTA
jgi:hypothetical protein